MRHIKHFRLLGLALAFSLAIALWQHPFPAHAEPRWQPPLAPPVTLITPYSQPSSDFSAGHRGVDYQVSLGQAVLAPTDAQVSYSGLVVNRSVLSLRTLSGDLVEFEPACSSLKLGTKVKTGDIIATICDANSSYIQHCSKTRCLHFSLRTTNGYLSPLVRLAAIAPSELLPRIGFSF